jgi:hypothetical protein
MGAATRGTRELEVTVNVEKETVEAEAVEKDEVGLRWGTTSSRGAWL